MWLLTRCASLLYDVHMSEKNNNSVWTDTRGIAEHFDMKPAAIIEQLNLKKPIFKKTASYGHFGRNEPEFHWEKTDKADALKKSAEIITTLN